MIKVLELFAGYGSQALALENLGIEFTSDISEIDKYAIEAYNQIHGQTKNYGDVCNINEAELPKYDLITYSSPCQDFSVAGKMKGGQKGSGTRSSLLWECERIIRAVKPKYLLMENVKNLVGKKFKPEFDNWLKTLDGLGYNNYWKVLNAKDYGVPQNRERVFVVSIRKDVDTHGYTFPEPFKLNRCLKDVLEKEVDEKYYLKQDLVETFIKRLAKREVSNTIRCGGAGSIDQKHTWDLVAEQKIKQLGNVFPTKKRDNPNTGRVYDTSGIGACLNTMGGGNREPCVLEKCHSDGVRIRKLTPKECWRLMGVKDEQYDRLHGISKTQLYKMAGNSIVVNVIMAIFKNLLISDKETKGQLYLL